MLSRPLSRRSLLRTSAVGAGSLAALSVLAACGGSSPAAEREIGSSLDEIAELAKQEGKVQLIAYPEDWANYKGHFEQFQAKYGVDTPVDSPDASSAEELQAVKNLKGTDAQPDVLDIGYSFTSAAIAQDLIEPYKPSNFDAIPDNLKHPEGMWVGAYYGALSIGVDENDVPLPASFADLKKPEYKGKVALPGDPRQGASSIATVFAAALANGGSLDDIQPGIDYFAELAELGNLVVINGVANGLATGQASVVFDWNYNFIGIEQTMADSGVALTHFVPEDGVYGNYYAQPVTTNSPQPNAARLWVDWLTSDEGAEQYALGGAVPARFPELSAAGKLSDEALSMLPDPGVLEKIELPTPEQGEAAGAIIAKNWATQVKY
ncbi:extracellular solute-binding protein [Brachybacterium sp. UNK5269]|uniref:ABC transporter substrate-binding protein n=1 Tax=Brachybacterium sp. UNK5269 TaxID=3408576 RepID=UPI003BB13592